MQRKHMKVKEVRRILKDVTRFLIDYQIYFWELINGKRQINIGPSTAEVIDWLRGFYDK